METENWPIISERQKSGHGGRRQGAGRPLGSKNRLPRGKKFDQFKEIVYYAGASEYLSTNENKLFDGSAIQLMQTIYQCEKLPVKLRCWRLATRPQQALNIVTIAAADLPAFVGAVAVARKRLETLVRPCMQDHGRELMLVPLTF